MLLRQIEQFLSATGMSTSTFGRRSVGDPRLVADLRRGRIPRARMERRVEHFMNIYQEG